MLRDMFVAGKWNLTQSRVAKLQFRIEKEKNPNIEIWSSFICLNRFHYHF